MTFAAAASALIQGAGYVRRDGLASYRASGADVADYLHRMTTQDIASLAAGQATYACLLTVKGKILGDMLVWRTPDDFILEWEHDATDLLLPVLEKFVIMDDVVFEDVTRRGVRYAVAGPEAANLLAMAGFEVPARGAFLDVEVGGRPGRILRFDRGSLPVFEIAAHPEVGGDLEERLTDAEIVESSSEAYDAVRVHHGIPRFGAELNDTVLFNESGLEDAVSWSKGCYPGQEPVVMAKHRGRPPRRLVLLALDGSDRAQPGAALSADDAEVGKVTSGAPAVAGRPPAALAYVRHKHAERGLVFELEGGGRAEVIA